MLNERLNFNWKKKSMMIAFIISSAALVTNSCMEDGLYPDDNTIRFSQRLSDYQIFQGDPSNLAPSNKFKLYDLSTELFTDYARKQRLIKIPAGSKIRAIDDHLPEFPDSTVFVKTFYYYHHERDTSKGKSIVETRLIVRSNSTWNVATYLWNDEQTDATLVTTGIDRTVNWINEDGEGKIISYHVPSNRECATCHNSNNSVIPIGPKLRNLNIDVVRNFETINQLKHLVNEGLLDSAPSVNTLPDWDDTSITLNQRGRAYLEMNCAHCHNKNGNADQSNLLLSYELSYHDTKIAKRKREIVELMKRGRMPFLGTTIVHQEGLDLIEEYVKSLN